MTLPSGQQLEIRHGDQRAIAVEVGGGLRLYEVGGRQVLDGYAEDEMCSGGRGALLVPWPNRIRDGRYRFDGQSYQLALTEPDHGHAIHGLGRWANWSVIEHSVARARLGLELHPQPGYPFSLSLEVEYFLSDDGLRVTTRARNTGTRPAPYGAGHHPYITVGTEQVDEAFLAVPARQFLELDERHIPTGGSTPVEDTPFDFRGPKRIGALRIDTPYTGLERGSDGTASVTLTGNGRQVTVWMDDSYEYVMVFTGDTVSPPSRRRQGLAIEPMTCPPDAFNSGVAVRTLKPNESLTTVWGIATGPA